MVLLAAAVASIVFLLSVLRAIWNSPAVIGHRIVRRRQKKGLEALSSGLIAVGAGDAALSSRYALQARKSLPHEPLTHLLRAQSAELTGDRATARRIYEAMLASPETEQLGLRGLFLEAEREGESEAARQFAGRALKANPKLGWSSDALFQQQCKQKDWDAALLTLDLAKKNGHLSKAVIDRKRAVLLTAKAQDAEDDVSDKALTLALEAHALAPDLVPAAAIAGRILRLARQHWKSREGAAEDLDEDHRIPTSPRCTLTRASAIAPATAWTASVNLQRSTSIRSRARSRLLRRQSKPACMTRRAGLLEPLLADRLTQRVATLMARIEAGENGEKGRVREWLARGVNAARDPVWMADGAISDHWEPTSPVDGRLRCLPVARARRNARRDPQ